MNDEEMMDNIDKALLLAPNYVKDVQCNFGPTYQGVEGEPRKKITITLEVNPDEATALRNLPGMDDQQFVAFLSPCLQVAIYKTIQQGMGNQNQVQIEEKVEYPPYPYNINDPEDYYA